MAKSVIDEHTLNEVLERLNKLSPDTQRQWGKMNVSQMLVHLSCTLKTGLGELKAKNVYVPLISPLMKRYLMRGGRFMKGATPTMGEFLIKEQYDFATSRNEFIDILNRFVAEGRKEQLKRHPFFGKMDAEAWGKTSYGHIDHHLRQFGV
ncbi:MAG: DUF1569 domain-containing protein [Sphingobacteriales bacterium JAD_PAG50586_3]|nr:MAG: DUF1569 domain-containing protein [Sphingobacteriales bacterium JAD_PAG50586_3]